MTVEEIEDFLAEYSDHPREGTFPIMDGMKIVSKHCKKEDIVLESDNKFFFGFVDEVCETITLSELEVLRDLQWFVNSCDKLDGKMFYHRC